MKYKIIYFLQCFVLTRWLWVIYQHEECGYVVILPIWKKKPSRYHKVNWKE